MAVSKKDRIFAKKTNMKSFTNFKYMKIKMLSFLLACCSALGVAELSYGATVSPLSVENKCAFE